jgi:glucose-1-phosphate cytidylyltransferase
LANVDIPALLKFHRAHGKLATLTAVRPVSRFGIMEATNDGCVQQFVEKPVQSGWANAGYFVLQREIFNYIDGDDCIFEQDPLERLVAERQLMRYPHEDFFFAMDTFREYKHLNDLWASQKAPWKVWT